MYIQLCILLKLVTKDATHLKEQWRCRERGKPRRNSITVLSSQKKSKEIVYKKEWQNTDKDLVKKHESNINREDVIITDMMELNMEFPPKK